MNQTHIVPYVPDTHDPPRPVAIYRMTGDPHRDDIDAQALAEALGTIVRLVGGQDTVAYYYPPGTTARCYADWCAWRASIPHMPTDEEDESWERSWYESRFPGYDLSFISTEVYPDFQKFTES